MPIVGWRRVASDNPCDFCAALVALGAHYNSEEGADFEAHDHCSCTAEPVWERGEREPGAVIDLQLTFDRVTGGLSGREALAVFRKWWRDTGPFGRLDDDAIRALDDDALLDRFHAISSRRVLDEDALDQVDREMTRRERLAGRNVPDGIEGDSPQQRRVDELLGRGWTIESAIAEAYDIGDDVVRRQLLAGTVDSDRRRGESRDAAARRLYDDQVRMQYAQAEVWTNANFLNRAGRAAGIDPVSLFSGPRARARKWASEELARFWQENPRMTFTEFRAQLLGRASDVRAAARLATGHERDFGL